MSDDLRAELSELARLFQTHVAWQRELGATELPRTSPRTAAAPAVTAPPPSAVTAPPAPSPAVTAPPPPAPAVTVPPPTAPTVTAPPPPAPAVVTPPPAAAAPPVVARALLAVDPPVAQADPSLGRAAALTVIQREVAGCTACKLAQRRTQTVFARGNPEARLVFIGEGPGEQEDKQGLPFVGPAGQLLDKIIVAMSLSPDAVYVCNVVKCRPPGNRTPEPDEVAACTPFLLRQLGVVRPEVIVTLGRTATGFLLGSNAPMSRLRGQWHAYQGIPLLPTWHPSYLLREPAHKGETWSDMKLVMQRLGLTPPGARG